MLRETTKIGLTFGQILAALGLFGGIIGAYVSLSSRITAIEVDQKNSNAKYTELREDLRLLQVDNKTDHIALQNTIREYNKELMEEISKLHR
jgi:hypothetical protein